MGAGRRPGPAGWRGVAAPPGPGARRSLRLAGVGPPLLAHPAGLDSSPRNPRTEIHFPGSAAWRRGLVRSPSICSLELSWPLFFLGEVGLCGEIVKREGAGSSEGFSTLQSLMLEVAAALSYGGRGRLELGSEFPFLGTPTDVSLPAKTRRGGGEEEEEREPAPGKPLGRRPEDGVQGN